MHTHSLWATCKCEVLVSAVPVSVRGSSDIPAELIQDTQAPLKKPTVAASQSLLHYESRISFNQMRRRAKAEKISRGREKFAQHSASNKSQRKADFCKHIYWPVCTSSSPSFSVRCNCAIGMNLGRPIACCREQYRPIRITDQYVASLLMQEICGEFWISRSRLCQGVSKSRLTIGLLPLCIVLYLSFIFLIMPWTSI